MKGLARPRTMGATSAGTAAAVPASQSSLPVGSTRRRAATLSGSSALSGRRRGLFKLNETFLFCAVSAEDSSEDHTCPLHA
jgi:hypothetical protein